jgi:hypothetical protein
MALRKPWAKPKPFPIAHHRLQPYSGGGRGKESRPPPDSIEAPRPASGSPLPLRKKKTKMRGLYRSLASLPSLNPNCQNLKKNAACPFTCAPAPRHPYVLFNDRTRLASPATYSSFIAAAIAEHPGQRP